MHPEDFEELAFQVTIMCYVGGVILLPLVGYAVRSMWFHRETQRKLDMANSKLEDLQDNSGKLTKILTTLNRNSAAQVYYLQWMAEKQTGDKPPPYIPKEDPSG